MNILQAAINLLTLGLSVSTAGSMLVHDTNFDKAMITAVTAKSPATNVVVSTPGNDPHTHSERGSLHQAIRDLNASQPRIQPRSQDRGKYVQAKPTARGHHPFDNYTLPLVY